MQENFLHHIWKYQKFSRGSDLKSEQNQYIEILHAGHHNHTQSGPDFFNAKIKIDDQLWAGNVEIHIKSSDWYVHHHENDKNYDNVILHVVWEDDVEVYRENQEILPSLCLKKYVDSSIIKSYESLVNQPLQYLNCEKHFEIFDDFTLENWLERLYIERLEQKTLLIEDILKKNTNNWEDMLFKLLCKNFGLNKNGEVFLDIAYRLGHKMISKHQHSIQDLESLLLGTAGLLDLESENDYTLQLISNYQYLKHKHQLKTCLSKPEFFRLRPSNFPTIRLAELAHVYQKNPHLFQSLIEVKSKKDIYEIFQINLHDFWDNRFSLTKTSKKVKKTLSHSFIDLLIINTIIPIKFYYEKTNGAVNHENLFSILYDIIPEKNSKVNTFENIRKNTNKSAFHSQALLQLRQYYCDKNYCLKCHLGQKLINQSV